MLYAPARGSAFEAPLPAYVALGRSKGRLPFDAVAIASQELRLRAINFTAGIAGASITSVTVTVGEPNHEHAYAGTTNSECRSPADDFYPVRPYSPNPSPGPNPGPNPSLSPNPNPNPNPNPDPKSRASPGPTQVRTRIDINFPVIPCTKVKSIPNPNLSPSPSPSPSPNPDPNPSPNTNANPNPDRAPTRRTSRNASFSTRSPRSPG